MDLSHGSRALLHAVERQDNVPALPIGLGAVGDADAQLVAQDVVVGLGEGDMRLMGGEARDEAPV
jgi:hypothetical protein